jgi:TRAP-type C4-dicarboxylate transport system permease small subunit
VSQWLTRRWHGAASAVASVLFAAVFCLFIYKMAMRYIWGDAVAWADELVVILFIWVIFWACAFVIPERQQITFDLVYRMFPPRGRRVIAIFRTVLLGGLFLAALPGIVDYLLFLQRQSTPVLEWPLGSVYSCFALLVAAVIVRAGLRLAALCGRRWRDSL